MRKFVAFGIVVLFSFFIFVTVFAGSERLHPALRPLLSLAQDAQVSDLEPLTKRLQLLAGGPETGSAVPASIQDLLDGEGRVGVLVKVRHPLIGERFLDLPIRVSTGTILGMQVTLSGLWRLAEASEVVYVEPAWRTEPKLDYSLPAIGADWVHLGPPGVKGSGVIIGAIDTGIDYTHLDFRSDLNDDGFEETSRILSIWDQTNGFLGTYYDRNQIEQDLALGLGSGEGSVRAKDSDGHGTHVMGVAAGDGSASDAGFVGVAPEAWIIMVKTTFYTSDILAGVSYIFERAEALGLPAVVNLSLGGHSGPHDGTSLFEQGLDELAQGSGRVVVVSAGNEGDQSIHVSRTLNGDSYSFSIHPVSSSLELSLWYPGAAQFTVAVTPPAAAPLIVPTGTYISTPGVMVDNATGGPNPTNGDNEVSILLSGLVPGAPWTFTVSDGGGGGRFDGWITSNSLSVEDQILGGDGTATIDEPGNANYVVTVGGFNTKARWPSRSGNQDYSSKYPIGALSYFSSQGPTRDGRQKPDIAAPAAWVASSLSADSPVQYFLTHPDNVHTMLAGTSVSAPHVSGVAALMLSLDPQLSGSEVLARLKESAAADVFTGSVPNLQWGWGKLDAETAVAAVEPPPSTDEEDRPAVTLDENPVSERADFSYILPERATTATLSILTVAGRAVFEIELNIHASTYAFELVDQYGAPLANGLYLYVLTSDAGRSEVGRLVIVR